MDNELPPASNSSETSGGTPLPPPQPPAAPVAPPPLPNPPRLSVTPQRKRRGWMITAVILAALLALSLFSNLSQLIGNLAGPMTSGRSIGPKLEEGILENHRSENKIAVIPVDGVISGDVVSGGYSLVEYIRDQFKVAEKDKAVKAVILKVESPGGEVIASDDIYQIISQFQKKTGKPVVASMSSVAASGGYYVSAPCRWIVANEMTITGSIGVILHSYNWRGLMDKVGVRPEVYKSGKFKDMLSPDKKEEDITPEERKMLQQLIDETFAKFKSVVGEGRNWAARENKKNIGNKEDQGRALEENWEKFADGRVLSGKEAFERGFVDELGNFETAVKRARKLAGIDSANLVQYQQIFDLSNIFRLLGKAPEPPQIKVDLGMQPPKIKGGHLYYLAPLFISGQ